MYRPIRSTGFEAEAEAEAEVLCTRHTRCVDTLSTVVKQKTAIVPDFTHTLCVMRWVKSGTMAVFCFTTMLRISTRHGCRVDRIGLYIHCAIRVVVVNYYLHRF